MTPSDGELLDALPGALEIRRRRPYEYATSSPLTEVTVAYPDRVSRMLLKDTGPSQGRPGHGYDPGREIAVYTTLLAPSGVGPALHASGADWLLLELVDGVELWQVGDIERWEAVASWLGRHHERFAECAVERDAAVPAPLDSRVFGQWIHRAEAHTDGRLDVGACRLALERLDRLPRTLVHGEFYPSNVLVAGDRVVPVDWETAAMGPGVIDLAALVTGWDAGVTRRLVAAYGAVEPADLLAARLALALRWLGWSAEWTAPAEHRQDWLREAVAAAEGLGV